MANKKNKKKSHPKRQAWGVLLLGVAVLLFVAVASFDINDPAQLNVPGGVSVHNWLGPLGASIAHLLMQWTLGYPVLVLPLLLFLFSLNLIRGKRDSKLAYVSWLSLTWALLVSVALAMSGALSASGHMSEFYPSGLIGGRLAETLVIYTGKFGSIAILFVMALVLLVLSFRLELSRIFSALSAFYHSTRDFISGKIKMISAWRQKRKKEKPVKKPPQPPEEELPVVIDKTDDAETRPAEPQPPAPEINIDDDFKAPVEAMPEEPAQETHVPAEAVQTSLDDILDGWTDEPAAEISSQTDFEVKEEVQNKELDYDQLVKESIARYKFPSTDLLIDPPPDSSKLKREDLEHQAQVLEKKLQDYRVDARVTSVTAGPVITLYELQPAKGVKVNAITTLAKDLAMVMEAKGIRILAPIPGKAAVGVEIPNRKPQIVYLKPLIRSQSFIENNYQLPLALGKTINGEVYVADLTNMPHLLIGGATNSGKSVGINSIILSLLYAVNPAKVKFMLVDPKKLELSLYKELVDHYLLWRPDIDEYVITTPKNAVSMLNSVVLEMDRRYDRLADAGVRNIVEYNEKLKNSGGKIRGEKHRQLPYLVVIIDELADLMIQAAKEVEPQITRLAQMARAVGIHLILATQRPSVNVITGVIKANFPARIAYKTRSNVDSRTILDMKGAEQLLGRGDMLYLPSDRPNPIRLQNPLVTTAEVQAVIDHIKRQPKLPGYSLPQPKEGGSGVSGAEGFGGGKDEYYLKARELVVQQQQASTSFLQRRLEIGYARAARIMDQLFEENIVGPQIGNKPREVLITPQELDEMS